MASPQAGTYRVVNVASPTLCLNVNKSNIKRGANLTIAKRANANAQYWQLSYRKDGTAQLLSRLSGMSMDVSGGTVTSGKNVCMWTDTDARNQKWTIQSDGQTVALDGITYPTYTIRAAANTSLLLDAAGQSPVDGANVAVYTANGGDNQRWAFVPAPIFHSGGIYEIRSMLKTTMAMDVRGGSKVRGANVELQLADGGNDQKFLVTEETADHWSIQNVNSGFFVDVAGNRAANGANVEQWTDNDARNQRWRITLYDTTTIDGQTCQVVSFGSYVTSGGNVYLIDASGAVANANTNVLIWTDNGGTNQKWALVPTDPLDGDMPVPAQVRWAEAVGSDVTSLVHDEAETLYPTFVVSDAWPPDSGNHCEWRYRRQLMASSTSTWGAWGAWASWEAVGVTAEGQRRWVTQGLPATVPAKSKAMQYEIQMRSAGPDADGNLTHGFATDVTLGVLPEPDVTFTVVGFGPEGLRLTYTADYDEGTVNVKFSYITDDDVTCLNHEYYVSGLDKSGSVLIPLQELNGWISDGSVINIKYREGTDQMPLFDSEKNVTLTVSYNTGSGLTATPRLSIGSGRTITAEIPSANVTNAWLRTGGKLMPMIVSENIATIAYPFGLYAQGEDLDYEVFIAIQSGDRWGVAHISMEDMNAFMTSTTACHAWNWAKGSFVLELRQGEPLETSYSMENDTTAYKLNRREWDAYRFGDTKSGRYTAEGAFGPDLNVEATRAALDALVDARHVTYRSPHGEVAQVAVLSAKLSRQRGVWTCTVEMARETV